RRLEAVRNRARAIADDAAQDRAAREETGRIFNGDSRRELVLGEERGGRAFRDQRAALLHELLQFHQAFVAHAAADVSTLIHIAEVRRFGTLHVWEGQLTSLRHTRNG